MGERKRGDRGGLWKQVCKQLCTAAQKEATGGQKIECLSNPGRGKGA